MEQAADCPAPQPVAEPVLPCEKDEGQDANGNGEGVKKKKGSAPDYAELEEILPVNAGRLKLYE